MASVHFTKRRGKVVAFNTSFAAVRFAYWTLTGRKLEGDKFQECGAELIRDFSESQIRAAVEAFDNEKCEAYCSGRLDI